MRRAGLSLAVLSFGSLPYVADSLAIARAYAGRWRIPLHVGPAANTRKAAAVWGKLDLIDSVRNTSENVLYLDADAVIANHEISPDQILLELAGREAHLVCLPNTDGSANSGVLLCGPGVGATIALWRQTLVDDPTIGHTYPADEIGLNRLPPESYSLGSELLSLLVSHPCGLPLEIKSRVIAGLRSQLPHG